MEGEYIMTINIFIHNRDVNTSQSTKDNPKHSKSHQTVAKLIIAILLFFTFALICLSNTYQDTNDNLNSFFMVLCDTITSIFNE